ncbi:MAG: YggS family pyridoxal phosphate-dependent enzyme [Hahellaceae bacterium]|nr:YggS family pyridoxal phosphate-dependent enzyme [Hahellaceae bacterium]MCP5168424.1 YggS family pyridoxal phosphate-dependent enzyme [Hahellaceae bacterium]
MSIADNLKNVRLRIQKAAKNAGRGETDIHLLAVSKTRSPDEIRALHELGQKAFGENYVQEALDKLPALADCSIEWHFIGPLQSNKSRAVATHFDWVHSVDRLRLAERLSQQRPANLGPLNICIQINIDNEESKSGIALSELESLAQQIAALPQLRLRGIMAIPDPDQEASSLAQSFANLKSAFDQLKSLHPEVDTLSMGMSDDMECAIAEGSTQVRIGTALFGPRPPKP